MTISEEQAEELRNDSQLANENLLQLWDIFVVSGWKTIFKMSLYILSFSKEELLEMDFEEMVTLLKKQTKNFMNDQSSKPEGTMYKMFKATIEKQNKQKVHLRYQLNKFEREYELSKCMTDDELLSRDKILNDFKLYKKVHEEYRE